MSEREWMPPAGHQPPPQPPVERVEITLKLAVSFDKDTQVWLSGLAKNFGSIPDPRMASILKNTETIMSDIDNLNTALGNLTTAVTTESQAVQTGISQIQSELTTIQANSGGNPAVAQAASSIQALADQVTASAKSMTDAVTAAQAALNPPASTDPQPPNPAT